MKKIILPLFLVLFSSSLLALEYKRDLFGKWLDSDRDCQNTRAEILIKQSLVPVTFKSGKKCSVESGQWNDFYYDETMEDASMVDIDHIVPLKHAFDIGAHSWSKSKKVEFANDWENLVVTNRKYNRQKGAKTILEWLPIKRNYACQYASRWLKVKNKYDLKITQEEKDTIRLLKCHTL